MDQNFQIKENLKTPTPPVVTVRHKTALFILCVQNKENSLKILRVNIYYG